jgi:putative transposase
MIKSGFSGEPIAGVLKEAEAGVPVKDLCRRLGVSDATFYHWKAKYGSLDVSEAQRLRQLEDENPSADGSNEQLHGKLLSSRRAGSAKLILVLQTCPQNTR